MDTIAFETTKWSQINEAETVDGISAADSDCLREVRDVLAKFGALDRFGINLLHRHFNIQEDEILLEITDQNTRTQTVRPVKKSFRDQDLKVTAFRFVDGDQVGKPALYCRGGGAC